MELRLEEGKRRGKAWEGVGGARQLDEGSGGQLRRESGRGR